MKNLFFILMCFGGMSLFGQQTTYVATEQNAYTTIAPNCRYQFIAGPISARDMFLVDVFQGNMYQLVVNNNDNPLWQKIPRFYLDLNFDELLPATKSLVDPQKPDQVNFQFFASNISAKYMYLVNTNNGALYQIQINKDGRAILKYKDVIANDQ